MKSFIGVDGGPGQLRREEESESHRARQVLTFALTETKPSSETGGALELSTSTTAVSPGVWVDVNSGHPIPDLYDTIRLTTNIGTIDPPSNGIPWDDTIQDILTFQDGAARASKAVWGRKLLQQEWIGTPDLGPIAIGEDYLSLKATYKAPIALASIKYRHRMVQWKTTSSTPGTQVVAARSGSLRANAAITYGGKTDPPPSGDITLVATPSETLVGSSATLLLYTAASSLLPLPYIWSATLGDLGSVRQRAESIIEDITVEDYKATMKHHVWGGSMVYTPGKGYEGLALTNSPTGTSQVYANKKYAVAQVKYETYRWENTLRCNQQATSFVEVSEAEHALRATTSVRFGAGPGPKNRTIEVANYQTETQVGSGLIVYLDGQPIGTTDGDGRVSALGASRGLHALRVVDPFGRYQDTATDGLANDWISFED